MTGCGNRANRLPQPVGAWHPDCKNRIDILVLDRPRKFANTQRNTFHRGRRNVILGKRRIEKQLIVRLSGWDGLQNTNLVSAQIIDRTQPTLRRGEQHGRVPAHDQNSLAARRHCDITAHDGQIGAAVLKHAR